MTYTSSTESYDYIDQSTQTREGYELQRTHIESFADSSQLLSRSKAIQRLYARSHIPVCHLFYYLAWA